MPRPLYPAVSDAAAKVAAMDRLSARLRAVVREETQDNSVAFGALESFAAAVLAVALNPGRDDESVDVLGARIKERLAIIRTRMGEPIGKLN